MNDRPTLRLEEVEFYERDVRLRLPFRFGVVTLTEAPQTFVRARIRLADGREGWGMAAELLAPKWFDKSPALSNEDNFDQLRRALAIAAHVYAYQAGFLTAFGLHAASAAAHAGQCAAAGLPGLVAGFGPALVDRAVLDALLRLVGVSVFGAARENLFGLAADTTPDLAGFDFSGFLASLAPAPTIRVRHTLGLLDALTAGDLPPAKRVNDGLPETLDEAIDAYGVTDFKLKLGGDRAADLDRLTGIARVLERLPAYRVTLDGNEQFRDAESVVALWEDMQRVPALARLLDATLLLEQPIARDAALARDIGALARLKPVEIDESDADIDAFPRATSLGYTGVSSKSCKGFYRSLLNRARCAKWNAELGERRYFMSAEDLSTQAGLALQQDLALATLIGCEHVERNGHHYVDGMKGASDTEQAAFLGAHPDLYFRSSGTTRVAVRDGCMRIASLDAAGLGSATLPALQRSHLCSYTR